MYSEEEKSYAQGYLDGGKAVLEELSYLFDGIKDTDVWKDFFDEDSE
jgi:hypothetical protein